MQKAHKLICWWQAGFVTTFRGGQFVSDQAKNRLEAVSDLAQTRLETRAGDNL